MPREIKFRAWDKKQKVMRYNAEQAYNGCYQLNDIQYFGQLINNSKYKLMQYTGLKDKNGKDVYEGDIVKCLVNFGPAGDEERICDVEITPFGINLQHWTFLNEWSLPEIIGNIYKNPELMEG